MVRERLMRRVTADGEPMPLKAESTIKAYRRKGWDTKHFLIRTGASTKMKSRVSDNKLYVGPVDPETLLYNTPQSRGRNTLTFELNPVEWDRVILQMGRDMAKGLSK